MTTKLTAGQGNCFFSNAASGEAHGWARGTASSPTQLAAKLTTGQGEDDDDEAHCWARGTASSPMQHCFLSPPLFQICAATFAACCFFFLQLVFLFC
ncbi:putative GPI-anchored adhesin-like protein PGA55 [Sesbania bispinosa]|nr:putative GPI-anchored adhesin-like protein PGA55 [Sesbania bispinosa]